MTFKRSVVSAVLAGAALFSGASFAGVSGNVGVVSEYFFRGVQQSGGAAVQGGLDYASDSGFYVGTWASTISFATGNPSGLGNESSSEVDFYAGFSGEAGSIGYDVGAIYYWYPEEGEIDPKPDPSNNTIEVYGSLAFGPATVGVYVSLDDYFNTTDELVYYPYLDLSFPMSEKLSLDLHVGQQTFDEDGIDDIVDYSLGVSADAGNGFSMGLAFVATDLDDDDPQLVISGGYGFDL